MLAHMHKQVGLYDWSCLVSTFISVRMCDLSTMSPWRELPGQLWWNWQSVNWWKRNISWFWWGVSVKHDAWKLLHWTHWHNEENPKFQILPLWSRVSAPKFLSSEIVWITTYYTIRCLLDEAGKASISASQPLPLVTSFIITLVLWLLAITNVYII